MKITKSGWSTKPQAAPRGREAGWPCPTAAAVKAIDTERLPLCAPNPGRSDTPADEQPCGVPRERRGARRSGGVVVQVRSRRPRVVPVLSRYHEPLLASAAFAGGGLICGGQDLSRRTVSSSSGYAQGWMRDPAQQARADIDSTIPPHRRPRD